AASRIRCISGRLNFSILNKCFIFKRPLTWERPTLPILRLQPLERPIPLRLRFGAGSREEATEERERRQGLLIRRRHAIIARSGLLEFGRDLQAKKQYPVPTPFPALAPNHGIGVRFADNFEPGGSNPP